MDLWSYILRIYSYLHEYMWGAGTILDEEPVEEHVAGLVPDAEVVAEEEGLFEVLVERGNALARQFEKTGNLVAIDEAIGIQERAIQLTPADHPTLRSTLNDLGNSFLARYERTNDVLDVTKAIDALKRSVELTPEGHGAILSRLSNLGICFMYRFECSDDLNDIGDAIEAQKKAVDSVSEGHSDLPSLLNNLGNSYLSRFERTGGIADIDASVLAFRRAIELSVSGSEILPALLYNLGNSLIQRFEHSEDPFDNDGAIDAFERAGRITAEDESNPSFAYWLDKLRGAYMLRFNRTGSLDDLTGAITAQERAAEITPDGHEDLPFILNNLGNLYSSRFDRFGRIEDVTKSISVKRRAIDLTAEGHRDLPSRLNNLGVSLMRRFERTGDISDITEAISVQRQAVDLTSDAHPGLPFWLNNLGSSMLCHFEPTGDLEVLADAITTLQRAVALTPERHGALPQRLNNLGNALLDRFHRTGQVHDIEEAVSAHQRAVDLTPKDHQALPARLNNLGNSLSSRFKRTGDLADIANAISAQQRAVHLTPTDHGDLPVWLNNIGNSYLSRYHRTGDLQDITEAIVAQENALSHTPDGHADLALRLSGIGISFACRFERASVMEDIDRAISAQRRAVDLTSKTHADLPAWLNNLGNSLLSRFERSGNVEDLEQSISALKNAVERTPDGHGSLPSFLGDLGGASLSRFKISSNAHHLKEAVLACERALHLTPDGHADLPRLQKNLGDVLYSRYTCQNERPDLDACMKHLKAAATSEFGPPKTRLYAAVRWARLLDQHFPSSPDILVAFDTAICLASLTAGLEDTVRRRYIKLRGISGLPQEAASAALSLGRADKALEWLEQGRCLVWGQLHNLRTPLDDLQVHDAQLAARVMDVSRRLDNAGSSRVLSNASMSLSQKISLEDEARAHWNLAKEWDSLLSRVRSIPGFEGFLRPTSCSELLESIPGNGRIVVINVHKERCDAIALFSGQDTPLHIPLPQFTFEKATRYRDALTACLQSNHLRDRGSDDALESTSEEVDSERGIRPALGGTLGDDVVHRVLRSLWIDLAKPILNRLGIERATVDLPSQELPRIWWCPTGPLSFLPIHAAGVYAKANSESLLDYAVSSYIPTVRALTEQTGNNHPTSGIFITSQPRVPGSSPIPGTTEEVRSIYRMATEKGKRVAIAEGGAVTVARCLEYMEEFGSIHLATHATQNAADPLQSRFLFHEGSLTLDTIIRRNLRNADLAFLSACQTSTGEHRLSDEAVHLAAGMLAAGYRRVVATMWSIGDKHAPEVANDFYQYVWSSTDSGGGNSFDGIHSAYALHHALQRLRLRLDESERSLLAWIPYVHFGS
ncbi:CHAT domain-containing protein [Ephemerocybe angulata]|uniref:CHAT domain-containing protein n=1 Tax=Ephemerocybe angulata TaxID=980116 RepID=A0A8H6HXA4_9AGAR|nr:CHAT domain-containing protein [Tulosesus angulatus]